MSSGALKAAERVRNKGVGPLLQTLQPSQSSPRVGQPPNSGSPRHVQQTNNNTIQNLKEAGTTNSASNTPRGSQRMDTPKVFVDLCFNLIFFIKD